MEEGTRRRFDYLWPDLGASAAVTRPPCGTAEHPELAGGICVGQRVEVLHEGDWYSGQAVAEVKDGLWRIQCDVDDEGEVTDAHWTDIRAESQAAQLIAMWQRLKGTDMQQDLFGWQFRCTSARYDFGYDRVVHDPSDGEVIRSLKLLKRKLEADDCSVIGESGGRDCSAADAWSDWERVGSKVCSSCIHARSLSWCGRCCWSLRIMELCTKGEFICHRCCCHRCCSPLYLL